MTPEKRSASERLAEAEDFFHSFKCQRDTPREAETCMVQRGWLIARVKRLEAALEDCRLELNDMHSGNGISHSSYSLLMDITGKALEGADTEEDT